MGREAQLVCTVKNAQNLKVSWIRVDTETILSLDDTTISRNDRHSVHRGEDGKQFAFHIRNVKPSDQGKYMCQINSDPMKATVGHLEVKVPPTFVQSGTSDDVSVKEGSGARLRCEAKGNPPPTVQWKREDGRQISRAAVRTSSQQRNKAKSAAAASSITKATEAAEN